MKKNNNVQEGKIKDILNNLILVSSATSNESLTPENVFHKVHGKIQVKFEEANGALISGEVVGKNAERLIIENNGKLMLLTKEQSAEVIKNENKWDY